MSLPFESAYRHGFARVAACTIPVSIADPAANAEAVLAAARECDADAVAVAVFPELCLTGYAIDDLVMQDPVLDAVVAAVERLVEASADLLPVLVVGAPLRHRNRLYNCALVIHRGELLGVAPKSYLPTYREFYERRWYAARDDGGMGTQTSSHTSACTTRPGMSSASNSRSGPNGASSAPTRMSWSAWSSPGAYQRRS